MGIAARAVTIDAVVGALRAQRAGKRQRLTGLAVTAQQLHRSSQTELGVVIRRRLRGDGLELGRRALVALGVEQRSAEQLADRVLVRIEIARFAERDDRRLVIAVLEQLAAALV